MGIDRYAQMTIGVRIPYDKAKPYIEGHESSTGEFNQTIGGLIIDTEGNWGESKFIYLGITKRIYAGYEGEWEFYPIGATCFETVKEELRVVLEPLGLWDEDDFGAWLWISCW